MKRYVINDLNSNMFIYVSREHCCDRLKNESARPYMPPQISIFLTKQEAEESLKRFKDACLKQNTYVVSDFSKLSVLECEIK